MGFTIGIGATAIFVGASAYCFRVRRYALGLCLLIGVATAIACIAIMLVMDRMMQ